MSDVSFMIVNERDAHSRAMYWELKRRAPSGIPVYQQSPFQDDVWEALDGDKDDFLVYDRCGLLTFHIVLPYSFLHSPYIEAAIRATYHKNICNCSFISSFSFLAPFPPCFPLISLYPFRSPPPLLPSTLLSPPRFTL
ncbi:Selenoprotein Pb [Collichthys lucidus]|uniref:Selenoprotein Pb n=1 Tax=Collichthys lucidus TaxID=240159 RepID=A0A4U5UYE1_COLLU|nr:Selenoprotein Pb [Collichthys lucidus]